MIRPLLTSLLVLLSTWCGRSGEPTQRKVDLTGVGHRAQLYVDAAPSDGWLYTEECDSLLFSGLYGVADLTEAEVSPGVWLRKPARYGECSPDAGTSRSTISRDGILGVYWFAWRHRDVGMLERLMLSIRENNYQLEGEGTLGELLLLPAHISTLAEMLHVMGSSLDVSAERQLSSLSYFTPGAAGYERHIMVWHILLRGEVYGGLSELELARIEEHVTEQPLNPLYAAAYGRWVDGDLTRAIGLLHEQYPEGRLPDVRDYCPEWPIQRDDVEPCKGEYTGKSHTGLDLVVIYRLILDR